MRIPLVLTLLAAGAAPVSRPMTYLVSLEAISIKNTEDIKSFSVETWGVRVKSVCHIPAGWWIKAGSSATPDGVLAGEGSQGATWFDTSSPSELRSLALVEVSGPIRWADEKSGTGTVPATFKGFATLETDAGDRRVALGYRNIILKRADHCPA